MRFVNLSHKLTIAAGLLVAAISALLQATKRASSAHALLMVAWATISQLSSGDMPSCQRVCGKS